MPTGAFQQSAEPTEVCRALARREATGGLRTMGSRTQEEEEEQPFVHNPYSSAVWGQVEAPGASTQRTLVWEDGEQGWRGFTRQ